jgi:hypothetical protein
VDQADRAEILHLHSLSVLWQQRNQSFVCRVESPGVTRPQRVEGRQDASLNNLPACRIELASEALSSSCALTMFRWY